MSLERRAARTWVTGLVIGLAVLIGVAWLLGQPYSRKPVDDYIAQQKAAGKPVTIREVIGPDPAPATNGAADLETAGKWIDEHKGDSDTWKVVGPWTDRKSGRWYDDLTDDQRRDLDAFFADAKPFFDGVAAGLAKPRIRVPTPVGENDSVDVMPRVRVIHVLAARAVSATRAQDRLDAAELLAKLAVRAESCTVIDDYVSAVAMDDATLAVRLSLARGDVDAAAWRARLDGLLSEPWLPRLRDGVRRQRAHLLELLRTADFSKPMIVSSPAMPEKPWRTIVDRIVARVDAIRAGETIPENSPEDFVRLLASTERFETASTDSYPRLAGEIAEVVAAAPKGSAAKSVASWLPRFAATLAKTDAACRLARIALAASEHRAKHGDFPASLDELKDAFPDGVPTDPFTDAPFVYEKTATGVRIASVGRLVEHPLPAGETLPDGDLVWELKR
jgi:hypothetical protein